MSPTQFILLSSFVIFSVAPNAICSAPFINFLLDWKINYHSLCRECFVVCFIIPRRRHTQTFPYLELNLFFFTFTLLPTFFLGSAWNASALVRGKEIHSQQRGSKRFSATRKSMQPETSGCCVSNILINCLHINYLIVNQWFEIHADVRYLRYSSTQLALIAFHDNF